MNKTKDTHALPAGYRLQSKERTYTIVRVLGAGSFGITYLASAPVQTGNIMGTMLFAIKEHFLSASCFREEDGVKVNAVPTAKNEVSNSRADFLNEANRLKELCSKSRSIVSVNEAFEANGTAYYVMEYLDGGNPSKCSEEEAVDLVLQLAEALELIHGDRLLHLDVKPDNIVMKTNDRHETYPVLIDFGIAKHFDSKGRPTSSLSAKGASPGYAPQEQYAGVSEFSPKYDVYALGAVLFYLVTGKNPPEAFRISPNQQELKRELEGKVSPGVERAILNAMKPNASERTPSIRAFRNELTGKAKVDVSSQHDTSSKTRVIGGGHRGKGGGGGDNRKWTQWAQNRWLPIALIFGAVVVLLVILFGGSEENNAAADTSTENRSGLSQEMLRNSLNKNPDLAFFNLIGDVKSLQYTCDTSIPLMTDDQAVISFDKDGNCPDIMNYLYLPGYAKNVTLTRNDAGEVIKTTDPDKIPSSEAPGEYEFNWNNGRLSNISFEAWENSESYSLSYTDGLISSIVYTYQTDGGIGTTMVNFSDYKIDDYGNWTECKAEFTRSITDRYMVGEEPQKETEPTETAIVSRLITYY